MKTNKISTGKNLLASYVLNSETQRPYAVGEPLSMGKVIFPVPEGPRYNYSKNSHQLLICSNKPTAAEIENVENGNFELALYVEKDIIDILFSFGKETLWSDAPYSWHINPIESREIPPVLENGCVYVIPFHIFLVDASTGIIKALRTILLSHEFASELFSAIDAQIQMPYDEAIYNAHVDTMYRKFSAKDLVFRSRARMVVPPKELIATLGQ
jgi:hypothetical protein